MKRYYNRSVSISKDFDSIKINEDLDKFDNQIENGWLVSRYDGREICRVEISKVYYNFDFTNFSKTICSEILNYFTPEKYGLRIRGVQEIRLVGDELYIDNERYEKMISIINSTDKTKALSMNIGLIRTEKGENHKSITVLTSFSNKHYKSSLPEKIESFSENLINFDMNINFHIKTIEDLKNNEVSLKDFAKMLMFNEEGKVIVTVETKVLALCKRLRKFYDFKDLSNIDSSNLDTVEDLKLDAKTLYSAYVELFRECDAAIISRESRRVIEALETIIKK